MNAILNNAGLFLIETLFDIYLFILLLRVILTWVGADLRNPVMLFTHRLTEPLLHPLHKFIPRPFRIDFAAIILLLVLDMVKLILLVRLSYPGFPAFSGLILWAVVEMLQWVISVFFYAILIQVIISWVSPNNQSPVTYILYLITEPLLAPARRIVPAIAGLDFSPVVVLILLKLLEIVLVVPLAKLASDLSIGEFMLMMGR